MCVALPAKKSVKYVQFVFVFPAFPSPSFTNICSFSRTFCRLPLGNKYSTCVLSLRIAYLFLFSFIDKILRHLSPPNGFFQNCVELLFQSAFPSHVPCSATSAKLPGKGFKLIFIAVPTHSKLKYRYAIFCISHSYTEIRRNREWCLLSQFEVFV